MIRGKSSQILAFGVLRPRQYLSPVARCVAERGPATETPLKVGMLQAEFQFLDAGELRDGDLQLVPPHARWVDHVMAACRHPATRTLEPQWAATTRDQIDDLLKRAPNGCEASDAIRGRVPVYHFWMHITTVFAPLRIAGSISLRIGHSPDIELYFGHVGYNVYPPARGRHYAERACRLLFDLALRHDLNPLWITTDPENAASRKTCERLGAVFVGVVDVPADHVIHKRGSKQKCRYRVDL